MSKKENVTETPVQEEKIVTRYDRRTQKRKELAEKERKEQKKFTIISTAVIAVIVCVLVSFPIRNMVAVNQTYAVINGEKINRVEFDYYYNAAINNYYNQYGEYLSYMGLDLSKDLSTQLYTEGLSWQDFFQQMAVENIKQTKMLLVKAEEAGFTYDATEDIKAFEQEMKEMAAAYNTTESAFLASAYGAYATMDRLDDIITEVSASRAYYAQLEEEYVPTDDEIQIFYEENKALYDSVDYRLVQVNAELPTAPTELADKEEKKEESSTNKESTDSTTEEAYEPSEAEIEAAMKVAKEKAEEAEKTVKKDGELYENVTQTYMTYKISEWLFAEERKAGDTTIIEDTTNNSYYVLAFEKRYRDETPTVSLRYIVTDQEAQPILDEWKNGAATEDSFIELVAKHSLDTSVEGGLQENVTKELVEEEMSEWLFAAERAEGDTTTISIEEGYNYVFYYKGQGEPYWKSSIRTTLVEEKLYTYMVELIENVEVEDPNGKLAYIEIVESLEAASSESSSEASAASSSAAQ